MIDEGWLEEHIFQHLAEVVGYMYDGKSGPPEGGGDPGEDGATGKITTRVERRAGRPHCYT